MRLLPKSGSPMVLFKPKGHTRTTVKCLCRFRGSAKPGARELLHHGELMVHGRQELGDSWLNTTLGAQQLACAKLRAAPSPGIVIPLIIQGNVSCLSLSKLEFSQWKQNTFKLSGDQENLTFIYVPCETFHFISCRNMACEWKGIDLFLKGKIICII